MVFIPQSVNLVIRLCMTLQENSRSLISLMVEEMYMITQVFKAVTVYPSSPKVYLDLLLYYSVNSHELG